jgi:uncharacterized membrane protein
MLPSTGIIKVKCAKSKDIAILMEDITEEGIMVARLMIPMENYSPIFEINAIQLRSDEREYLSLSYRL